MNVRRILLERTATLETARTYTSLVVIWQESIDLDICVSSHGVDNEGWGGGGITEELADELATVVFL